MTGPDTPGPSDGFDGCEPAGQHGSMNDGLSLDDFGGPLNERQPRRRPIMRGKGWWWAALVAVLTGGTGLVVAASVLGGVPWRQVPLIVVSLLVGSFLPATVSMVWARITSVPESVEREVLKQKVHEPKPPRHVGASPPPVRESHGPRQNTRAPHGLAFGFRLATLATAILFFWYGISPLTMESLDGTVRPYPLFGLVFIACSAALVAMFASTFRR